MAKGKGIQKVPINDVNLSSFLSLKGIVPELSISGSHVVFLFPSDDETYRLAQEYNNNVEIPVLDFVAALRRLRAQMMALRGQK
ncbi:DUF5659 domain-containing protein [Candidatus Magnetominusculus dajiuhuensis]|uniref:DUF5659 domain-containing protein n=1 Tax=Candidatus Magnetominusculus dajiuhuensis TaxID=3137712 RepID=UPI003B42DD26